MIERKNQNVGLMVFTLAVSVAAPSVFADDASNPARLPPAMVIDAPAPAQSSSRRESPDTETAIIYDSRILPGFHPCTTKEHQNAVICEEVDQAHVVSTREKSLVSRDLTVEDEAVPQGNIFRLKFGRIQRKKVPK